MRKILIVLIMVLLVGCTHETIDPSAVAKEVFDVNNDRIMIQDNFSDILGEDSIFNLLDQKVNHNSYFDEIINILNNTYFNEIDIKNINNSMKWFSITNGEEKITVYHDDNLVISKNDQIKAYSYNDTHDKVFAVMSKMIDGYKNGVVEYNNVAKFIIDSKQNYIGHLDTDYGYKISMSIKNISDKNKKIYFRYIDMNGYESNLDYYSNINANEKKNVNFIIPNKKSNEIKCFEIYLDDEIYYKEEVVDNSATY